MNITSTGLPRKSESETIFPPVSGNLKSGAGVPSANMVEGVIAMGENVAQPPRGTIFLNGANPCPLLQIRCHGQTDRLF